MNNSTERTVARCAWCIRDSGEQPQPGESHGICSWHLEKELRGLGADQVADTLAMRSEHSYQDWRKRRRKEVLEFAAGVIAGILLLGLAVLGMLAL